MCALHTNGQTFKPLVNSRVDKVLVETAPDLNQPLFQFINGLVVCIVNTFLNGLPCLIVNEVEVHAL